MPIPYSESQIRIENIKLALAVSNALHGIAHSDKPSQDEEVRKAINKVNDLVLAMIDRLEKDSKDV